MAVEAVESYRQDLEAESEKPVKIVLLVDEVTLFIGGDYQRLSELNALAEYRYNWRGNIQMVATAQSQIEDVRPGLAAKQLDFRILKDRFPTSITYQVITSGKLFSVASSRRPKREQTGLSQKH